MDHVGESRASEAATSDSTERFAFVTLVTSDSYVDGALVLLHSLRRTQTPHSIICLATPSTLSQISMSRLRQHFDGVIESDLQQSSDTRNLSLLGRPDLRDTLTKIQLWDPALFGTWSAICYLDADTLVRLPIDDVFDRFYTWRSSIADWRHGGLVAASPDTGWPDCFNSGVMLLAPGYECNQGLLQRAAKSSASFDGADQGLLNEHFADWTTSESYRRLPFLYNATANVYYTYLPALQRFGHDVRVVHFIGILKPWHWERTPGGQLSHGQQHSERWRQLINLWWNIHDEHVSGWRYWKGPFDKGTALGQGYHHITVPVDSVPINPSSSTAVPGDSRHYQAPEDQTCTGDERAPEVPDWDKDWSWAADRVHPFDYSYLMSHTDAAHLPPSQSYQPHPERPSGGHYLDEIKGHSEQHDTAYQGSDPHAHDHDDNNRHGYASVPDQPPSRRNHQVHQEPLSESSQTTASQWMGLQRPWEDVAREGWQHHGDFQPHSYDHAYAERHAQPSGHYHKQEQHLQPEYAPVPRPDNQPLYEATQVVLQQCGDGSAQDHGYVLKQSGQSAHKHGENQGTFSYGDQHHNRHANAEYHPQQAYQQHQYHGHHGDQQQSQAIGRRGSQSTTSSSPLHYPQPKSPIIVNPVALWESSEEQARRRAWAQHMEIQSKDSSDTRYYPDSGRSESGVPWTATAPRADTRVPPSAMDNIDSSQLPHETPWKISHVRHRPTGGIGNGSESNTQPPSTGMQFKEGVANDANARDAAGQLLQRWNEAVIARNIQSKIGNVGSDQISHSTVLTEKGTDAIRLETTVSCEAEDSKGERTVYRFTLSSTLDIGGALSPSASQVFTPALNQQAVSPHVSGRVQPNGDSSYSNPRMANRLPQLLKGTTIQPLSTERGIGSRTNGDDSTSVTDLRQPENYQEPAMSRRSSFVHMQPTATCEPHVSPRGSSNNSDQFAEADSRYWKLQRQLIDLEMRQQVDSKQDQLTTSIPPYSTAARNLGMVRQNSQKLHLASPPTPSYPQSTFKQNEQPPPLRRRPSAFKVADPATLAPEVTVLNNMAVDDLDYQTQVQMPNRGRSRSSPKLVIGTPTESSGTANVLTDGEAPVYPKRSHSHSVLHRTAVKNSAHAQTLPSTSRKQPRASTRPVFITSLSDSAESDEELDEETFKSAIGRSPTPFPRRLRKSVVHSHTNTSETIQDVPIESKDGKGSESNVDMVGITGVTLLPEPDLNPAHKEKTWTTPHSSDFGISSSAVSSPRSPGEQKIRPTIDWGDDDSYALPPDEDRSFDAQWRRIVYGAPPPRASVTSRFAANTTRLTENVEAASVAENPAHLDHTTTQAVAEKETCSTESATNEAMGTDDMTTVANVSGNKEAGYIEEGGTEDSKSASKKDTVDIVNESDKLISVSSSAKKPVDNKPSTNTRAPPRKLHSTRSFLNLTSQIYETTSDSELDTSEAEQQERFWARAMKPSKSGMSTPYSPGRRRSVAELSSLISPKDLEEWMQWQNEDSGNASSKFATDDVALPAGSENVKEQNGGPVIPTVSNANEIQTVPSVASNGNGISALAAASEPKAGMQRFHEYGSEVDVDVHNALDDENVVQDSSVQFVTLRPTEETTTRLAPAH